MKEFVEKLIEILEEESDFFVGEPMGSLQKAYYCKGVEKAIKIVKDLAEEHNNKVMIDEQYCWQTCGATEHCKECNRLSNGYIDYYENYDCLVEEPQDTWKQQTMSRFERVE